MEERDGNRGQRTDAGGKRENRFCNPNPLSDVSSFVAAGVEKLFSTPVFFIGGEMDMDMMQVIAQLGFPIAVAVFVLYRLEPAVQQIREALTMNTAATIMLLGKMGYEKESMELLKNMDKKGKDNSAILKSFLI